MPYEQGQLINDGGEGCIYEVVGNPNLLMKIYNERDIMGNPIVTEDLHNKLKYMQQNPPEDMLASGTVAWPLELLYDDSDELIGFVMPRMNYDMHISHTYNYVHPKHEAEKYRDFPSVNSRIKIALNLCSALYALHNKGYIVGDFNHDNIGVSYSTDRICLMDCDSFHITDEDGNVFRTNVIMQGYLAPEIIFHCNDERAAGRPYNLDDVALPTFSKESDLFCLAIHIFKLLMNGADPFRGEMTDSKDTGTVQPLGNDAIEQNMYVFRNGFQPSAVFCPPAESLPRNIITLFNDAFLTSRDNPSIRPDSTDWYHTLEQYQTLELIQCKKNEKHQYYKVLKACPYCAADNKMKDILKGKKKWHDSIGIVASICGIILAGGIGIGVIFSLIGRPMNAIISGGENAPGVELWHEMQQNPPSLQDIPTQTPTPAKPEEPPPPELPEPGSLLRKLYDSVNDSDEGISLIINWTAISEEPDDLGFTTIERLEETGEWYLHNRWGGVHNISPVFAPGEDALTISLPGIDSRVFYLHEDRTGAYTDDEDGFNWIWEENDVAAGE